MGGKMGMMDKPRLGEFDFDEWLRVERYGGNMKDLLWDFPPFQEDLAYLALCW
jgi:hypothetical protein